MGTLPVDPDSAASPSEAIPEFPVQPTGVPIADTFGWVTSAVPDELSPAELPDLIVAASRLISHLQAVQVAAVAEFAKPGRCGSMTKLIDGLIDHTGFANRPGGKVDPEAMSGLIAERAQDMAAAEISAALHQAPLGASRRVSAAVELVEELPATLEALKAGRIDWPRARMIAERTANLDPTLRTAVEARVLPLAETRTPGQLRPMIDLRVIQADPTASKKRADKARKDRFVDHTPSVDGMGMIRAHLTAEGAVAVFDLLDRIAKATVGMDERGIAACRADALVDMCMEVLANGFVDLRDRCTTDNEDESADRAAPAETTTTENVTTADAPDENVAASPTESAVSVVPQPITTPPGRRLSKVAKHHGRGAHFNLTMSLAAFTQFNQDPAELLGHGFLPAHIALAMKTSIRSLAVIVVNDLGQAMAVGSTAYLPTQQTRDQVLTAAGTCRFPSCRIPGPLCDLDHRAPYDHHHPEQGGQTDAKSLDPLSRHHHFLKTFTDWTATRSPDDGLTMLWTSPTGHQYVDHPKEFGIPDHERPHPADERGTQETDLDDHECCPCVHLSPVILDGGSTAQSHAEQTKTLIARRDAAEAEDARLLKAQRIMRDNRSTFVYRLGMETEPWADDEDNDDGETQEEFNARMEAEIAAAGSYETFRTQNNNTLKRFNPIAYGDNSQPKKPSTTPTPTNRRSDRSRTQVAAIGCADQRRSGPVCRRRYQLSGGCTTLYRAGEISDRPPILISDRQS